MIKADELLKKRNGIRDQINLLGNLLVLSQNKYGLKVTQASVHLKGLDAEIRSEFGVLIDEALKPVPPRTAKKILQDIDESERVSPELLAEIRDLLKEQKDPKPPKE